MLNAIYRAAMGMRSQMEIQDTIAHNLANVDTTAFKRRVPFAKELATEIMGPQVPATPAFSQTSPGAFGTLAPAPVSFSGDVAYVANTYNKSAKGTDVTIGSSRFTGGKLDVYLESEGFYTLQTPEGTRAFTRNGSFTRDVDGDLATSKGMKVLADNGGPINIDGDEIIIFPGGQVVVDGEDRGSLLISQIGAMDNAFEMEGGYYQSAVSVPVEDAKMRQGYLENSNVNAVEEMVAMITSLRAYEMAQKAIQSSDGMLNKAVNEVGRVG